MPLIRVKGSPGRVEEIFIAAEPIGKLVTVYITPGSREVKEGDTQYQAQKAGVSIAGAVSGAVVRVVTAGFVSGVVCASSVVPGDRIAIASTSGQAFTSGLASGMGKITPFNTITPAGTISRVSGWLMLASGIFVSGFTSGALGIINDALFNPGGLISGIDGFRGEIPTLTGTAFNTGRILGLALTSAAPQSGSYGAQILVMPGG